MNDNLNITLNIAGEQLRLTIPRQEEEIMREAASQINQVMRKMQKSFNDISATHAWARVALAFARGYLVAKAAGAETEKMLATLESRLDSLIAD
ncbi:MAG: cell division protein ZapA [Pseudoflavonifractor sp.]|nr:cell division protein ZapA [Alloprevotella sp.]MCM1117549.1 cell division protein ZapA [Pseudoflavonifractor sp.]